MNGLFYKRKFVLMGDGRQAQKHRKAIDEIGGEIIYVYDPIKYNSEDIQLCNKQHLYRSLDFTDYVVICTPNNKHYEHTKLALRNNCKAIVEKPLNLPWEPIIDNDRLNVVLQYRYYLDQLPEKADLVKITTVRNPDYFKTWKGDKRITGGIFYHLFVHYIDLAILLGASFEGNLVSEGEQERVIIEKDGTTHDIMHVDMQDLYNKMYNDIVYNDGGIKPKDIFYLNWVMNKFSMYQDPITPYKIRMGEWRMD